MSSRVAAAAVLMASLAACTSKPVAVKHPTTTTPAGRVGALPLGDGRYTTSPQRGSVDSCITEFHGGGAFQDGPWIDEAAKTWDATKKISVQGSATRRSEFAAAHKGAFLELTGNGLPSTPTGTFPVQSSDPAYQYDRNPNVIRPYVLKADLPFDPPWPRSRPAWAAPSG